MWIFLDFLIPPPPSSPPAKMGNKSLLRALATTSLSATKPSEGPFPCPHTTPQKNISKYYVCNPTTKEFAELREPGEVHHSFSHVFVHARSPYYKVVNIGCKIHIYSSENRSWKLSMHTKSLKNFKAFTILGVSPGMVHIYGERVIPSVLYHLIQRESIKKLLMAPEVD